LVIAGSPEDPGERLLVSAVVNGWAVATASPITELHRTMYASLHIDAECAAFCAPNTN
jgi:hypothetical protein